MRSWAEGAGIELDFKGAAETETMMSDLAAFYQEYKDLVATSE